jgi:LPS-assembly protein
VPASDGPVRYPEYVYMRVYQSYDFQYDFVNDSRFSNIIGEMDVSPCRWMTGTVDLEFDHSEEQFDRFDTGIRITDALGDRLESEYVYTRDDVEEFNVDLGIRVVDSLDLSASYRHNLLDNERIETVYGLDYRHQCWELSVRVNDINKSPDGLRDNEVKVSVLVTLSGLGSVTFD